MEDNNNKEDDQTNQNQIISNNLELDKDEKNKINENQEIKSNIKENIEE